MRLAGAEPDIEGDVVGWIRLALSVAVMRVLVATTAGAGHFGPTIPFARACVAAGHEVRVAAPMALGAAVVQAGFEHVPLGSPSEAELAPVFASLPRLSLEESNAVVMRDVFAGLDARAALQGMSVAVRDWRPDLIMRETAEFSSYVVAEAQRIPHVQVAMGLAAVEEFAYPLIDDALTALGSHNGAAGLRAAPMLSLVPECLEDPEIPDLRAAKRFRARPADVGGGLGDWWSDVDAAPGVCNLRDGRCFRGAVSRPVSSRDRGGRQPAGASSRHARRGGRPGRPEAFAAQRARREVLAPTRHLAPCKRDGRPRRLRDHDRGVDTRRADGRRAVVRVGPALQRPGG